MTETVVITGDGTGVVEVGYAQPQGLDSGALTAETSARIAGDSANADAIAAEVIRAGDEENLLASQQTFTAQFTGTAEVTVPHNLSKYPAVSVTDSAGDSVFGNVTYAGVNSLTVSFSAPFSGTVTCN